MIEENVISIGVPLFRIKSDGQSLLCQSDTQASKSSVAVKTILSADIRNTVAFEIGFAVPEVQAVFSRLDENNKVLHIWAVIPERERNVYRKIYSAEKDIIDKFGHIGFDFNVIASCGRDPGTLLNNPGVELSYLRR
jgi:hypothetical protein